MRISYCDFEFIWKGPATTTRKSLSERKAENHWSNLPLIPRFVILFRIVMWGTLFLYYPHTLVVRCGRVSGIKPDRHPKKNTANTNCFRPNSSWMSCSKNIRRYEVDWPLNDQVWIQIVLMKGDYHFQWTNSVCSQPDVLLL